MLQAEQHHIRYVKRQHPLHVSPPPAVSPAWANATCVVAKRGSVENNRPQGLGALCPRPPYGSK
eukprot:6886877-Karenia_brevis.AAC.1